MAMFAFGERRHAGAETRVRVRAPRLWRPLPASLAGGAGARPDHTIPLVDMSGSGVMTQSDPESHVARHKYLGKCIVSAVEQTLAERFP